MELSLYVLLHWPFLWSPLCMCTTIFGGQQSCAHHEVAGCSGVHWCGILCSSSSSSEALGAWAVCHLTTGTFCITTLRGCTLLWRWLGSIFFIKFLFQSHVTFWLNTAAVHSLFTYVTWCNPPHFLVQRFTGLRFIQDCEMWLRIEIFPSVCTIVYVKFTSEEDEKT